jgi:hypothetical protein
MPPLQRATIRAVPSWLRSRMLVRLAGQLVRSTYQGSRVVSRQRGGLVSVDVRASIFCTVREPVHHPLCGFYAAAFTRLLELFNLHARAEVVACRGTGEPTCVMKLALLNGKTAAAHAADSPHHEHDHAVAHDGVDSE